MSLFHAVGFITILALAGPYQVVARNFTLQKEIRGNRFFSEFTWWSYADPTHGFVDYVTKSEAQSANLSYINPRGDFVMRVDSTSLLAEGSSQGRKSVRIHSVDQMSDGIILAKFNWMPQGCGTWPAFWTCTTDRWPRGGEIDIVEGANDQGPRNLASLHTLPGCQIPAGQGSPSSRNDSGFSYQSDCQRQPGCSVQSSANNSFGPDFNQNGGGYFAMIRDTAAGGQGISTYFWSASPTNENLPTALQYPALPYLQTDSNVSSAVYSTLNPLWSTPAAHFPNANSTCPMQSYFEPHEIIIDTTLCGSWAGETFPYAPSCPRNVTCEDYVRGNPSAFEDARFEIEYLRVYGDGATRLLHLSLATTAVTLLTTLLLILA